MCLTTWQLDSQWPFLTIANWPSAIVPKYVDNQIVCYCSHDNIDNLVHRQLPFPNTVDNWPLATVLNKRWHLVVNYRSQLPWHSLNTKHSFPSCHYHELYAWLVPQNQRTILVDGLWIDSYNGQIDMTNLKSWINKKGTQKVRF